MQGKLTPLGVFVKWVIAPLILGWIGYAIIGPQLGSAGAKKSSESATPADTAAAR